MWFGVSFWAYLFYAKFPLKNEDVSPNSEYDRIQIGKNQFSLPKFDLSSAVFATEQIIKRIKNSIEKSKINQQTHAHTHAHPNGLDRNGFLAFRHLSIDRVDNAISSLCHLIKSPISPAFGI